MTYLRKYAFGVKQKTEILIAFNIITKIDVANHWQSLLQGILNENLQHVIEIINGIMEYVNVSVKVIG